MFKQVIGGEEHVGKGPEGAGALGIVVEGTSVQVGGITLLLGLMKGARLTGGARAAGL